MNTRNILILLAVLVVLGAAAALAFNGIGKKDASDGKLSVVASFYPVYFFAEQIGGERAHVTNVTPAGAEAHDYAPTPRDLARIERSGLLVLNGGDVDVWGERVREDLDMTNIVVVVAGEDLMSLQMEAHEDEHEDAYEDEHEEEGLEQDPHVWLSPVLAARMVDKITAGFVEADSANADYYQANAEDLKNRLAALDAEYRAGLTTCESRNFITSHAAFGYLAHEYGLTQTPIAGLSPDEEPSAQELVAITEFAREHDVKYIFFETLVSPKLSETIAREVGAHTLVLNPLEGLSSKEIAQGGDYFTEMQKNLTNLTIALSCTK